MSIDMTQKTIVDRNISKVIIAENIMYGNTASRILQKTLVGWNMSNAFR
jgi:hypothetical protein